MGKRCPKRARCCVLQQQELREYFLEFGSLLGSMHCIILGMKKSDVQCPDCGAGHRRIELVSRKGPPGAYHCLVCKNLLETFDGSHEVAYRLTVNPERPAGWKTKKVSLAC
jgi:hypothetical protein